MASPGLKGLILESLDLVMDGHRLDKTDLA